MFPRDLDIIYQLKCRSFFQSWNYARKIKIYLAHFSVCYWAPLKVTKGTDKFFVLLTSGFMLIWTFSEVFEVMLFIELIELFISVSAGELEGKLAVAEQNNCVEVSGVVEEVAVSLQNNCLAILTLFWTESSMYDSATLVDFHPPCLFIAAKSAPESDKIVADDLRKQCPV